MFVCKIHAQGKLELQAISSWRHGGMAREIRDTRLTTSSGVWQQHEQQDSCKHWRPLGGKLVTQHVDELNWQARLLPRLLLQNVATTKSCASCDGPGIVNSSQLTSVPRLKQMQISRAYNVTLLTYREVSKVTLYA